MTDRRVTMIGAGSPGFSMAVAEELARSEIMREYWIKDIEIPRKHGVAQTLGENGGPGGQIHAMRNITMFMDICRDMRELCPDAWLMNFTNPMSRPHYREQTCTVMEAFETNQATYLTSINIINHGAIPNLPADAVVDIPAVTMGGQVRGVHVGELPLGCAELCRRQITLHELVVQATMRGDRQMALQAMRLQPPIRSLAQARAMLDEFLREYAEELPQFA